MSLARVAGAVYAITFIAGSMALLTTTGRQVTNLIAAVSYIVVTVLFYFLFRPVNRGLSLAAAIVSLAGCVMGVLSAMRMAPIPINPLAFFGVYCLLIGYLIFNSTYLPRALGILMAFGGLGWLTFAAPALARLLTPFNFGPGIFAEGVLTLWLLFGGVNSERWSAMVRRQS